MTLFFNHPEFERGILEVLYICISIYYPPCNFICISKLVSVSIIYLAMSHTTFLLEK